VQQRVATLDPSANRRPITDGNGSLNVLREHGAWPQRNRRTDSRSSTLAPLIGKSESVRSYLLWQDPEGVPQLGQIP